MGDAGKYIVDLTGDSDDDSTAQQPAQQSAEAAAVAVTAAGQAGEPDKRSAKKEKKRKARIKKIGDFFRDRAAPKSIHTRFRLSRLASILTAGQTVVLGNPLTQHIGTTLLDRGWACGYRNCQMLLSSVMSCKRKELDGDTGHLVADAVPSVRRLQEMLETAWSEGYDEDGAQQLGHRVLGTRKWIGTTEIYCILAHLGVRAGIVDFHCPTAADGSHPALFSWIFEYFTDGQTNAAVSDDGLAGQAEDGNGNDDVRFVAKHPLYLQHQGHSRTVVGIEMGESGVCLLVFDPDVSPGPGDRLSMFRYTLFATRGADQYQVLYIDADDGARDIPKQISSQRIP